MLNDYSTKKTIKFGEKLLQEQQKMSDESPIPVIEMRSSMEEDIAKKLQKFVEQEANKFPGKSFYILAFMGKDMSLETVVRLVMQARWTKPDPQPSSFLYYFDHKKESVELIWSLPPDYSMAKILAMPWEYDPQLVQWVKDFQSGKLAQNSQNK